MSDHGKFIIGGGILLLLFALIFNSATPSTNVSSQNRTPIVTEDSVTSKKIVNAYTACVDYKGDKTDIESAYCNFIQLKMKELNNRVNVQKKMELDATLKAAMDVINP